jgi:amino acid adenylation domain-containing protein
MSAQPPSPDATVATQASFTTTAMVAPRSFAEPPFTPNAAHLLWRTASATPDRVAIVDGSAHTRYRALRDRAADVSARLDALGVQPGERVGILLQRGADAAAAFFGVLAMGGIAININETLRARQVEYVLSHSGAKVLLTSNEMSDMLGRALETSAKIIEIASIPSASWAAPIVRVEHDPAQIIYTSGSTGQPKGVLISHGNLWAGSQSVAAYTELTANDRLASLLPFSFDYGFNQLLTTLLVGATLVVERSPLAATIAATLRKEEVTLLPCVPPLWLQLLGTPAFRAELPALRAMTNTGGRLPETAVRALRTHHPKAKLFLMYGLTEAFRSTFLPPEEADRHPDSIGRAIPGAQIMVLTEAMQEAGVGEEGELVHRGPTVALGYWNDPEATAKVYRPNPLRPAGAPDQERVVFSGDLVKRDADGFLYYVARRDKMIKTMGHRVSPDEVASVLYASKQVVEVIIATEPDEARGSRIIAHVVLTEGATVEALQKFAGTELPRYMQPARFEVHASLPRTSSGKHDPKALVGEKGNKD